MITKQKKYHAGIYLRLSQDDDLTVESGSIATQREKMSHYCNEKMIPIVAEYCDDGWSGSNFERPGFKKMLQDIYSGRINVVITKDLSRFGRNYLDTGTFIEKVFDEYNVRYIAIDDNVDTLNGIHDIMMPIKNVINDLYSKDISRKTISALNTKAKNGQYLASKPAYGYTKDPNDNHKLVIDPVSAEVVRQIFQMASISYGYQAIVRQLTQNNILTPQSYFISENPDYFKDNSYQPHSAWNNKSVKVILDNQIYLGHTVYGKTRSKNIRSKGRSIQNEDEWIITKNTHEAIVTQDLWDKAHEKLNSRKRACSNGDTHIFAGLIFCEDCHAAMTFWNRDLNKELNGEFICSTYKRKGKNYCSTHYITFENVYKYVLADIKQNAVNASHKPETYKELINSRKAKDAKSIEEIITEIEKLKRRRNEIDGYLAALYEDRVSGIISLAQFVTIMERYDAEQADLKMNMDILNNQVVNAKKSMLSSDGFVDEIQKYTDTSELDRLLLSKLIKKVFIGQKKTVATGGKSQEIIIDYNV